MRTRAVACFSAIGLICAVANGQTSGEAGASASRPASAPASQPTLDPAVEKILDRLESKNVRDVQADLVYVKKDPLINLEQKYKGILRFIEDKPSPRFLIRFDQNTVEGVVEKEKEWHVFDGRWYTEARERTKVVIKREVVKPGDKGAEDLFRIGKGPFPMPFGQKKDEIVRHFTVKLVAPGPADPPNSDHLECTPLPGTDMDRRYGKVHFLIDRTMDVPVRVTTIAKEDNQEISASFTNVKLNKGMAASEVNLPSLPGYEVREEPLGEPAPAAGAGAGAK